jgi:transcriptional regulator with XRE-family HTH domain
MAHDHPLRAYRSRENLTQAQLAKRLGLRRETIARWEIGAARPDRALLSDIEAKTGVPAKELRPDLAEILGIS